MRSRALRLIAATFALLTLFVGELALTPAKLNVRSTTTNRVLLPVGRTGTAEFLKQRIQFQRQRGSFKAGEVIVVFRQGYSPALAASTIAAKHPLTDAIVGDQKIADALRIAKAQAIIPLFGNQPLSRLSAATSAAQTRLRFSAANLSQAYIVKISAQSPAYIAALLERSPSVQLAEPNFFVSSMLAAETSYPTAARANASTQAQKVRLPRTAADSPSATVALPTNYALTSSLSSFLNANALDWTPAYEMIEQKYSQLPGQGEIITNVSVGDLTDPSENDDYTASFGTTTTVLGNQRYLDIPSFPLIPTYVADQSSSLDALGTVKNSGDYEDGEILLDFSVMAPLPHSIQRPARQGDGLTDLLGIAPGAQYRLIVPQQPTFANIGAALLAASQQQPAPNVITASLGFGTDSQGFPGRFLEDDPIMQTIIASIVQRGIVVCISANDGTRLFTNTAIGPDGGSTPTNVLSGNAIATNINDIQLSTTPSVDPDTGSLDVGGTTLDDIFSVNPSSGGPLSSETAFTETRLNGSTLFSSGFGSRVNISAPSDGIASLSHNLCIVAPPCTSSDVHPVLEAGTSASTPEVAAVAAVLLQVARLSGKALSPADLRALLVSTGRNVPTQPQVDQPLNVGPQADVGAAVQSLLHTSVPSIPRIAIAERQAFDGGVFEENTDPAYINLDGPVDAGGTFLKTNTTNPITIAPDWVALPADSTFALYITGQPSHVLATTRWTRLLPEQILNAAGLGLASPAERTVSLTYRAAEGHHLIKQATFDLTFSPTDGTTTVAPTPIVPAVVQAGQAVTVTYDLSKTQHLSSPAIVVSNISHWNYVTAPKTNVMYSQRLVNLKGTITLPATAFVGGGGMYGVAINMNTLVPSYSEWAPIRVKGLSDNRPAAPLLSDSSGGSPGHFLEILRSAPSFGVTYDLSSVPNANGAVLEISAPGPNLYNSINNFNNPFGTQQDNDGFDTGSTLYQPLSGLKGTATFDALKLGLSTSAPYNIRVIPVNGVTAVGQASAVSTLVVADTNAPGGQAITGFDVVPGGIGSVATTDFLAQQSNLYTYDATSEQYGTQLYSAPNTVIHVIGSDPTVNSVVAAVSSNADGSTSLYSFDAASGAVKGAVNTPVGSGITSAAVDPGRHRVGVAARDSQGLSSLFPFDLQKSTTGTPVPMGNGQFSPGGAPTHLTVDTSTGTFYAWSDILPELCPADAITSVNIDTGAIGGPAPIGSCDNVIVSDNRGRSLFVLDGPPVFAYLSETASDTIAQVDAHSLAFTPTTMGGMGAIVAVVDNVNNVLLVGYLSDSKGIWDNTGGGLLVVYDIASGQAVKQIRGVNFIWNLSGNTGIERGLQIDPATRTGWTYSGDGLSIQQFSY